MVTKEMTECVRPMEIDIYLKIIFRHGTRQTHVLRGTIIRVWYVFKLPLTHISMKNHYFCRFSPGNKTSAGHCQAHYQCLKFPRHICICWIVDWLPNLWCDKSCLKARLNLEWWMSKKPYGVRRCTYIILHGWNSNIQLEEQEEKQRFDWRRTLIKLIQNLIIFAVR